jgi:hypothetical protein
VLPPARPDATPTWRHARITGLIREIGAPEPADAGRALVAAQMLILHAPSLLG